MSELRFNLYDNGAFPLSCEREKALVIVWHHNVSFKLCGWHSVTHKVEVFALTRKNASCKYKKKVNGTHEKK